MSDAPFFHEGSGTVRFRVEAVQAAVRRWLAAGSAEPVMLREADLRDATPTLGID
ncbi:MAG: hypothetical protein ABI919_02125 [Ramlibacter sp.]